MELGQYKKSKVSKKDFGILKVIGRGSYGKVYMVNYIANNQIYAMKSLKKEMLIKTASVEGTKGKPNSVKVWLLCVCIAERELLERLDHPFIMKLLFAFQDPQHLYLIMDFVNGGELFYHLARAGKFEEARAQFYTA